MSPVVSRTSHNYVHTAQPSWSVALPHVPCHKLSTKESSGKKLPWPKPIALYLKPDIHLLCDRKCIRIPYFLLIGVQAQAKHLCAKIPWSWAAWSRCLSLHPQLKLKPFHAGANSPVLSWCHVAVIYIIVVTKLLAIMVGHKPTGLLTAKQKGKSEAKTSEESTKWEMRDRVNI